MAKKTILIPNTQYVQEYVQDMMNGKILQETKGVYVGTEDGDFPTLGAALEELSKLSPVYKKGGISCKVCIRENFTITEQIFVSQIDLQYITIVSESEDGVDVDGSDWEDITNDKMHDTRDNIPFILGENAAKLPTIGTIFKFNGNSNYVETENIGEDDQPIMTNRTVGLVANRGSSCVILPNCGFDGFYDGVIANNESSIVIREGVAKNCNRYGIHARHNGEISARSAILTGNGIAACADRCADIDMRKADCSSSKVMAIAENVSRINANGAFTSGGTLGYYSAWYNQEKIYDVGERLSVVQSGSGSIVNLNKVSILYAADDGDLNSYLLEVFKGGIIIASGVEIFKPSIEDPNVNASEITVAEKSNIAVNNFSSSGIIYN